MSRRHFFHELQQRAFQTGCARPLSAFEQDGHRKTTFCCTSQPKNLIPWNFILFLCFIYSIYCAQIFLHFTIKRIRKIVFQLSFAAHSFASWWWIFLLVFRFESLVVTGKSDKRTKSLMSDKFQTLTFRFLQPSRVSVVRRNVAARFDSRRRVYLICRDPKSCARNLRGGEMRRDNGAIIFVHLNPSCAFVSLCIKVCCREGRSRKEGGGGRILGFSQHDRTTRPSLRYPLWSKIKI